MGSKAGEEVVVKMEESDEKTQIKLDSEMNKYEPNSNFSGVSKNFETLPSPSFSKLLEGVVLAANSSSSSNPSPQPAVPFQGQFVMSHQEALGTITAIAAHALRQTKSQDESVKSLIKLPISQSETVSSNPSVVAQQAVSSLPDKSHVEKGTAKIFSTQKSENKSSDQQIPDSQSGCVARVSLAAFPSAQEKVVKSTDATPSDVPKTPKSDGYSWRKYGQKQIKSSGSSRSYFRCTNLSCSAKKKVQHLDGSGEILDVVYKGNHNHDPPPYVIKGFSRKKVFSDSSAAKLDDPCTPKLCSTEPKPALQWTSECQDKHSISPVCTLKTDVKEHDIKIPNTTIRLEGEPSALPVKVENNRASSSNGLPLTATKNERDIPIKKRRIKESGKECSEFVYRTFKEPKVVVLPADLGISSDGYRWRKYGQKMVKGNSHPRSYYRCSTAGCPVRKHVERATDGSSSIVAMYEGEHDHDKPVPKKQHSWAKSPLPVNPQTNTINNVPLINSEEKSPSPGRGASPAQQCEGPNNNDSGEQNTAPKPGPEKVLEAAQARASLGIELKSC